LRHHHVHHWPHQRNPAIQQEEVDRTAGILQGLTRIAYAHLDEWIKSCLSDVRHSDLRFAGFDLGPNDDPFPAPLAHRVSYSGGKINGRDTERGAELNHA